MGFLDKLRESGTDKDKLLNILTALKGLLASESYRRGSQAIMARMGGTLLADRVRREWEKEVRDMHQNLEAKLEVFLRDGRITQQDYGELMATYERTRKSEGAAS